MVEEEIITEVSLNYAAKSTVPTVHNCLFDIATVLEIGIKW